MTWISKGKLCKVKAIILDLRNQVFKISFIMKHKDGPKMGIIFTD